VLAADARARRDERNVSQFVWKLSRVLVVPVLAERLTVVRSKQDESLVGDPESLYSGRIWAGGEGIELGLADAYGSPESVARSVIGAPRRVDYTPRRQLLDRALEQVGSAMATTWSRLQGPSLRP